MGWDLVGGPVYDCTAESSRISGETDEGDPTRFESRFDQRRTQNLLAGILDHGECMSFLNLVREIVADEEVPDPLFIRAPKRVEDAIIQSLENAGCVGGEVKEVNIIWFPANSLS